MGDLKCDGRRISTRSIFQCYAPYLMKDHECVGKVNEDFHGARAHWGSNMAEWIFVHNDSRGLPPTVVQHLDGLRAAHPALRVDTWSEPELLMLTTHLGLPQLQALFGYAPSIAIVDRLILGDLLPIIDALERQEPEVGNGPITLPSADKLDKNALSEEAALLLRIGRRKSSLVGMFFRKNSRPDLGERIAEAFRSRYAELKSLGLPADAIFKRLQDYAGMDGEPKRQGAALAVLSYFFETCDIFEDPTVSLDAS